MNETAHMMVCASPVTEITKIKVGDRVAWEGSVTDNHLSSVHKPNLFGGDSREGRVEGTLGVFFGHRDQGKFPDITNINTKNAASRMMGSSDNTPAYRGVLSLLWHGIFCANNPYPKPWEVFINSFPSVWYPEKQTIDQDINPAHIIHELITSDSEIGGLGLPSTVVDQASFRVAADVLHAERFGF